ncbi:MAG: NAD(P)/FAD-dependent oxidoreductase [Pseudomonadota bacterium]
MAPSPENLEENDGLKDVQLRDVAIIGAGPVGLFAIFECGMMGMSAHVIDALPEIGGQCTALYPEKPIYDIPGYPMVEAGELIHQLEKQAAPFKPEYHLNQQVTDIYNNDAIWDIKTSDGNKLQAKTIIIAAGAGAFGPNRPPLDNIEEFEGRSIFYMVKNKQDFADKNIVIAGGGDSALDWAISLSEIAKSVYLIHRRDKFRALPDSVDQMHKLAESGKIELFTPCQLSGLEGENGQISHVMVKGKDGEEKSIEADVLLPFYGLSTNLGPILDWNLDLSGNEINAQPTTAETSVPRVYAIGDIAAYSNKKKFILTGFSEAAFAAHHIHQMLYPDASQHFEYSTTKGVPSA